MAASATAGGSVASVVVATFANWEGLTSWGWPSGIKAQAWVPIAWVMLGLLGTGVQLGITGRKSN